MTVEALQNVKVFFLREKIFTLLQSGLILAMYVGALVMWPATIEAVWAGRVIDGLISWMTLGCGLVFFQLGRTRLLVRHSPTSTERTRRLLILGGVYLNLACNLVVILLLGWHVLHGSILLGPHDIVTGGVCIIVLLVVIFWTNRTEQLLTDPLPLFLLAVFSRIAPQATMVFSSHIQLVPLGTVLGILIIATQRVSMMSLESWRAQDSHRLDPTAHATKARDAAKWTWRSDVMNWSTAAAVFGVWLAS